MASAIREKYLQRTRASAEAHARAREAMPGGTSRQAAYWAPYPLTVERGAGAEFWDIDGNHYLEFINNYTSMAHGHAYPPIIEAVTRQLQRGTGYAAANAAQTTLAERIKDRMPGIDQVRFTNSGTEAAALAFTIARIVTGRRKLLMARYGYHGSLLEFETGSFGRQGPLTYLAKFNDLADFQRVLDEHGEEIAAVFLEPVLGSGGVIAADSDFLKGVMAATRAAGAIFVLDEVLTFRFGLGGCQTELGIQPDLTMLGKIIGGGFPVGAVGGNRELLKIFEPSDMKVFHTGTFNANPVTMVAGDISVEHLDAARIAKMDELCLRLREGLLVAARKTGLPLAMNHHRSCLNLYFSETVPESSVVRTDTALIDRFHCAAMNHGLFIAPRGMIALSTVMTEATIDDALARAQAAMHDVAAELD